MNRFPFLVTLVMSILMTSCDYFGEYCFQIENLSSQNVEISYFEQLRSTEDILPTYEHGEDYPWILLEETPTIVTLKPDSVFSQLYSIGSVNRNWPTEEDTPERYHIISFWDRIDYIVIGTDTLDASKYAKEEWKCDYGWKYTLTIH